MSRTPENSPTTVDNLQALSVTDLLAARDLYHHHLTNKPNVVGTAIGRYLIREQPGGARTLVNSRVEQGFSWPCVMVFISDWAAPKSLTPYDYVPKQLFMPDGRVVPVCKVQVDPAPVSTTRGTRPRRAGPPHCWAAACPSSSMSRTSRTPRPRAAWSPTATRCTH